MNGMRILKIFVILGGVLLLASATILSIRMFQRTHATTTQPAVLAQGPVVSRTTLSLEPGSRLQSMTTFHNGLALFASHEDGGEILLLDSHGDLWKRISVGSLPQTEITPPSESQIP